MGKITNALKKAAEDRVERFEKISRIKEHEQLVVKKIGDSKVDQRIVTYFDPKALITEQYKILRTNVLSINKNKPPKVIVMTSSLHSEGKTLTTLNLAMALAELSTGDRNENLRRAIRCCQAALRVYDADTFPRESAALQARVIDLKNRLRENDEK